MADTTGSIVLDLRKDAFTAFPPTSGDSIVASAPPTLASADHASDTVLAGWTTTINAGDVVRAHVVSCTGITRIALALKVTTT
jgi:exosome complex RNA-binding protein Csl4